MVGVEAGGEVIVGAGGDVDWAPTERMDAPKNKAEVKKTMADTGERGRTKAEALWSTSFYVFGC